MFSFGAGDNLQTLMSPTNLQFFFERYKLSDFDTISRRFSFDTVNPLNNKQIEGIYKYLQFIIKNEID